MKSDALFYKEFRDMMNARKSFGKLFDTVDLPLPDLKTMTMGSPKRKMALVKNCKEPFFEKLNNTTVQLVGRTTLQKRLVNSDGSFRKDANNSYVCTQIPVKHDCVAIMSPISIGLRRTIEVNGKKQPHKPSDGYRYVDYVNIGRGKKERMYIYIVPKSFVYRLNLSALVLTPNRHRNYYSGCKLALQNGNYVYMYVVPYKYRTNAGYRILGVKPSIAFGKEINEILKYWMSIKVLFNLNLTSLEEGVKGVNNLGFTKLEPTLSAEDYEKYCCSMADEKEDEDFEFSE